MRENFKKRILKGKQKLPIIIIIIIIIIAALAAMFYSVSLKTDEINKKLDESAYMSLQNSLQNLNNMMTDTFIEDENELKMLASSLAGIEDKLTKVQNIQHSDSIDCLYYADKDANVAKGKNNQELVISDYTFTEHANGGLRSKVFMSKKGTYSYILCVPVEESETVVGYLYASYFMTKFSRLIPSDAIYESEVSILNGETLDYVYIPSINATSIHVNFQMLDYYIVDKEKAPEIIEQVKNAIKARQYYMNMFRMKNSSNPNGYLDTVIYMWPVDDGEYYLSGLVKVDDLQHERVYVEATISSMTHMMTMIAAIIISVLAFVFGWFTISSRQQTVLKEKHNKELAEALRIAKMANESKSNFLSNMSHDIRTPMNAIVGYTSLITKDADNAGKVKEYAKKISGSGNYLLGLINDILDMSKIESGKTTLSIVEFKIGDLIEMINSVVRPQAEQKKQWLKVYSEGIVHEQVYGDKTRIQQVLLNLLSNALKYTPEGGKIWVSIVGLDSDKSKIQRLKISVKDNGYGMEEDYIQKIFEPFSRANNSMTGNQQGTGLGMAITKNIIDLMGGTISVESKRNQGSTFTVVLELPIVETDNKQFWQQRNIYQMLVIDNDIKFVQNVEKAMGRVGVKVDWTDNGRDGLEQIKNNTYPILLIKESLPNENIADLIQKIRDISGKEQLIFLSAPEWKVVDESIKEAGIDDIISRNFFASVLENKIQIKEQKISGHESENNILNGMRILAAEDNELNAEILVELLKMEGASCKVCEDGQKVVDIFNSSEVGAYDLILMDVQMPNLNGYEATKKIRSGNHAEAGTIPIIAMTANAFVEDVQIALRCGMNAHIAKPVNMDTLKNTIKTVMGKEAY